ncbi:radical SAM protein [bacterium]|nr:radical SAM protein [bacterium]
MAERERKMDVILISPVVKSGLGTQNGNEREYMYPYSIIYLHNYLTKHGMFSKVFDLCMIDEDVLLNYCEIHKPDIIGVTCNTHNRYEAIDIIKKIKKISTKSTIVVGGDHFSYCAEETLENIREIDIVVRGEGEITFHELVKALKDGEDLISVDGISYRRSSKIIRNEERQPEKNIDKFNLDYDKLPREGYNNFIVLRNYEKEKIRAIPMLLARGCSQKCVFCSFNKFRYRARSLDSVFNEIRYLKDKYKINNFSFNDPSFCERRQFVKNFCERLIKEDINVKWYCEARVDTSVELLKLMAEAGCISLDFGLESGSNKVLKAIRKNINIDLVIDFAKNCKDLGIRTLVFVMISLPEEKEGDAYQTLKIVRELSKYCTNVGLSVTNIFPGTELEQIARRKGILPKNFSWYDAQFNHKYADLGPETVPLYLENLSIEFIRAFMRESREIRLSNYLDLSRFILSINKGIKKITRDSLPSNLSKISLVLKVLKNRIVHPGR